MEDLKILEITEENVLKEGLFCSKNPKYEGFHLKLKWIKQRWKEGLKLKILKKGDVQLGFIEYMPAEVAWRPVKADNYMFIQCLMVYGKKNYGKGYGSLLVKDCIAEAQKSNKSGVVTITSKGSWLPNGSLFARFNFEKIEAKDRFEFHVLKFKEDTKPAFINWHNGIEQYQGLNLVYANQCPYFTKSIEEMKQTAKEFGQELKVTLLKTPKEAQNAPSGFGVYSLVYNGKILADNYISNTRFKNILNKEIC